MSASSLFMPTFRILPTKNNICRIFAANQESRGVALKQYPVQIPIFKLPPSGPARLELRGLGRPDGARAVGKRRSVEKRPGDGARELEQC